jgi:hypothetical protein
MVRLKLALIFGIFGSYGICCNILGRLQEKVAVSIAMNQLSNPSAYYDYLNYINTYWQYSLWGFAAIILFGVCLFYSDVKKLLKGKNEENCSVSG